MAVIRVYPDGEYVDGTKFDDKITTFYHNNLPHRYINGHAGDDLIIVRSWSFSREHPTYWDAPFGTAGDRIDGGAGNDTVRAPEGANNIYGGTGHDVIFAGTPVYEGAFDDPFFWRDLDDVVYGGSGNDTIYGQGGPDRLFGNAGADHVFGGQGDDTILGGGGHDRLWGGDRNDLISGGRGNDVIDGGKGSDTLTGDAGADKFIFTGGRDRITDFQDDVDTIKIDRDFYSGSKAQLFRDAEIKGGNAVFDLDGKHKLIVENVDALSDLRDDVFLF
ncbi:calcium-binding protein [Paracoccus homiensis]|uniref:Hemolysin-type calcium-binding repeat-containing protein n=1 Tax=Paracoccus homiensis TaxID=364199 RepID=A0A1I0GU83_9RHOB|nr:calcium-binding protein [Paracoccus homiensis]SET74665.1 Hemolysin-type calcium-binding repeat-containing protein [Paracoccus homiensis]